MSPLYQDFHLAPVPSVRRFRRGPGQRVLRSPSGTTPALFAALAAVLVSVGVGTLLVSRPLLALLPLAALAAVLLFVDGRARTVFVLLGGMFLPEPFLAKRSLAGGHS